MANTSRQTAIFGIQDWKRLYKTYQQADFQSYNFETLRKSFIDYLRQYHPESFNDFVESSEFIAMLDVIAFMGQSLAFRSDLNTRENFLDTAERRDSVVNLAKLVGYTPKRNIAAKGFLKVTQVKTTENVLDYNRNSLSNVPVRYNDCANLDWQEQFKTVMNAIFVNSQTVGKPGNSQTLQGVRTDEYTINTQAGLKPVIPFSATVDGIGMQFEIVSGTSLDKSYVYEPAPVTNADFNVLHRSDNLGYASANTGWFFMFKQGRSQTRDFNLTEKLANRQVNISIDGINNSDVWLYKLNAQTGAVGDQWTQTDNIYGSNTDQTNGRKMFSVTSRANDQITLNFGDGVFAEVPVGSYRTFVRSSNGLEYTINPVEMQSIEISVPYVSRLGRNETATFTLDLQENVSNSQPRESIADIKRRAPARFYTQNRMVNGEDYNNFPYTQFSSIIKSKAVNRSNIGASRYLDLIDPTGKYSSINTFSSDGVFYERGSEESFGFTFVDTNDIDSAIKNQVEPALAARPMLHFYYKNFLRKDLTNQQLTWNQSTTSTNITTGYFVDSSGNPATVGSAESSDKKFIDRGGLIQFTAPAGKYFDRNNILQTGTPGTNAGDKTYIWASVTSLVGDGTNSGEGNDGDGIGPVAINNFVPTDAVVDQVIPVFNTDLTTALEQSMIEQIELYRDFGLRYDNNTGAWAIVTKNNLADADFSLDNAGDTSGTGVDSSWLIKFTTNGASYTVAHRALNYYFASVEETRFFYDDNTNIYDPKTGKTINDFVKVLKTNSKPDSNSPLTADVQLDIIGQTVESDGFINDFNVEISFSDNDQDGIPDDPDFFDLIVDSSTNPNSKLVFFERTVDFDNLERLLPLTPGTVVTAYATLAEIELAKAEYSNAQVFYATSDQKFYKLTVANTERTIAETTDYTVQTGRGNLQFQYKHNAPESRRINPGVTNIIDLYVATNEYYTQYTRWIQDTTNTVERPTEPTTTELSVAYSTLNDYKMMSDNLVYNTAKFKPLFGSRAETPLQATFKVIKLSNIVVSDSEIKSRVIEAVNRYFDIENWDFGDTFYFSELGSYLHEQLGSTIGSVVLLPKDPTKSFGDLYQVNSAANEIFVSAATVNDVEIVDSLSASQLRITNTTGVA